MLAMPLSFFLIFLSLILAHTETAVYYVKPIKPVSNPAVCPGQPCQTLDYYFSHGEEYFNGSKVNITMLLLGGEHILSRNRDIECMDMSSCLGFTLYGHVIKDLNMFEMIGMQPPAAHGTVVQLFTSILVINTTVSKIAGIEFFNASQKIFFVVGCLPLHESPGHTFITVVNRTNFNGIMLFQVFVWPPVSFSTTVTNSQFNNQSEFNAQSMPNLSLKNYVRELIIQNCTVSDSYLELSYVSSNITIFNSTLRGFITIFTMNNSSLEITGTVLFSNTDQHESLSANFYSSSSSYVKIAGNVIFADSIQTSISASLSTITLSGNISFLNNTGVNGGAMALYSSTLVIAPNTSVYFHNNTAVSGGAMALYHFSTLNIAHNTSIRLYDNTATESGGAIYLDNNVNSLSDYSPPCFYQLLNYRDDAHLDWYNITFCNNSATNGGDDIYGEFMHSSECYAYQHISSGNGGYYPYDHIVLSCCVQKYFHYGSKSISSVSSDPLRVCLCKSGGLWCNESTLDKEVYPGETFTLSVAIVGADFGATVGSVHAVFKNPTTTVQLKPSTQYIQGIREIGNGVCSELNYAVFSMNTYEILMLTTRQESWRSAEQIQLQANYYDDDLCSMMECNAEYYASMNLLLTQLLLNVSLLLCPLGFQIRGNPPGCECHPVLTKNNVTCLFINHTGYHIWSGPLWLNIDNVSNLYLAQNCLFDYYVSNKKTVDFQSDHSAQCAFNRAGRLCGGCKEGYSLAIGSSHCIYCPNNNNLALLIFFAVAGFLLVVVIGVFNLTVAQGMINGLVFYANIVWTYQSLLLSQQVESHFALAFLRALMAWINLDFGINACFIRGLNALHKTWPQYFFILYIWSIAIAIIFASRRSTKLTKVLGNRPVPVLVTIFLLSYTKLLQIIIDSVGFTHINVFGANNSENYSLTVWSLDGNYIYYQYPHILLFIAALLVFLAVWLPYTLVMLSVLWLRKISHLKLFKFDPIFDAHLGPLKDKRHYWFGILLLVRGLLLVILTLTYTVYPNINFIVLLITASLLLFYSNYHSVYKRKLVQLNESFFLLLLILIGATGILEEKTKRIVTYATIGVGLLAFCGIVIVGACYKKGETKRARDTVPNVPRSMHLQTPDDTRDAILDEIEPLFGDTDTIPTY